ncbi:LPXTG cell wall anchor domain-containing protein [Enterococcus sp. BWM-S5]|uniref:LPXTG cell wall anchor domain-containing protein n=1 Tax=Enterococcus larvae TaxID=2794352 RepID=A0ABS4CJE4_9ENTE|nr:LPXTG cell wall anchor domain-containing protein [Enterococcus larvae]MBP1046740.1 LPXTG cell wall anchor domain-containing protein [Enterococcus larvae]
MKKRYVILLSFLLLLSSAAGFADTTSAASGTGGQVNSKGQITFYEGSSEPITTPSSSEPTTPSTTVPSEQKPAGGKLANLGEQLGNYSLIGICLVLGFMLLFLYRRKKNKEEK